MTKIGRNDPCPCGSGRKFKKCCESMPHIPSEILKRIREDQERTKQYGHVRPNISIDFHGYKMVAVGDQMHYSKQWKTFHDFLFDYIKNCLGKEWGDQELKKAPEDIHPILDWYKEVAEFRKVNFNKDGISSVVCTGITGSYLALAYDLYVLRHHSKLQERLLNRLRNKDQFQGARYELYVAAAFIKAGYDIEFENEYDGNKSHCEFNAIRKDTGKKYSVEVKSRHRPGFLGQRGTKQTFEEMRLRIGGLLNDALNKDANHERIIFIDVNMPPEEAKEFDISWSKSLPEIMNRVEKERTERGINVPAFLFFTNHPAHYVGKEKIDPPKNFFLSAINVPEFKVNNPGLALGKHPSIFVLWESINTRTHVPHEFEKQT